MNHDESNVRLAPIAGCCHGVRSQPSIRSRRTLETVAGIMSLGVWILIPKCPMCLAAHVALWTGLGLSFTQAAGIRWSLMCLSGLLLCYLALKMALCLRETHVSACSK